MLSNQNDTYFLIWFGGFFDGEGSLSISIHKHPGMLFKHQISLTMEVTQADCFEKTIMDIYNYFKKGDVTYRNRKGSIAYPHCRRQVTWRVRKSSDVNYIVNLIAPYLRNKADIVKKYQEILLLWRDGVQNTPEGFIQICRLRDKLNDHRAKGPNYLNADYFVEYFKQNPVKQEDLEKAKHYRRYAHLKNWKR